jgi:hypothetical protein
MTPLEAFAQGEIILEPVIGPHGFKARALVHGHAVGGDWASGLFLKSSLFSATRRKTVHIQQRIVRVDYEIGKVKMDHVALAEALSVSHRYPAPEGDAISDFQDLAADLHALGHRFSPGRRKRLESSGPGFRSCDNTSLTQEEVQCSKT